MSSSASTSFLSFASAALTYSKPVSGKPGVADGSTMVHHRVSTIVCVFRHADRLKHCATGGLSNRFAADELTLASMLFFLSVTVLSALLSDSKLDVNLSQGTRHIGC